jgi:uncharacterized protein YggE
VTDDRVTVSGLASRSVAPDTATWRAEAVETADDPRAAFERCTSRLNALVERLAVVGDVSTDSVRVEPRWEEKRPGWHAGDRRGGRALPGGAGGRGGAGSDVCGRGPPARAAV